MKLAGSTRPEELNRLQGEIESFVARIPHGVVVEGEEELFDLDRSNCECRIKFGKLILEVWNPMRSLSRAVEEIAFRDPGRLGLFVRRAAGGTATILEIREAALGVRASQRVVRGEFRRQLMAALEAQFPAWKFEQVSNRSDRENSLSGVYTRGVARQGRTAWAFLGAAFGESPVNYSQILGFGLVWIEWLRANLDGVAIGGLRLFMPPGSTRAVAHRMAFLNPRRARFELFEGKPPEELYRRVEFRDYGNLETRLRHRRGEEKLLSRHRKLVEELLGDARGEVDIIPDTEGKALSLCVRGREFARIEGELAPRILFGMPSRRRLLRGGDWAEFRRMLKRVLRNPPTRKRASAERSLPRRTEIWLESVLSRDVSKINHLFDNRHVYRQVCSFAGEDRGVADILTRTRSGRLAVLELKMHEEINFALQGLDYWMRIKWLNERRQLQRFGYFPGVELAADPPLLYLISPAFRFHSTIDSVAAHLSPEVEVIKVGIADTWRDGVKVLFRRRIRNRAASTA